MSEVRQAFERLQSQANRALEKSMPPVDSERYERRVYGTAEALIRDSQGHVWYVTADGEGLLEPDDE